MLISVLEPMIYLCENLYYVKTMVCHLGKDCCLKMVYSYDVRRVELPHPLDLSLLCHSGRTLGNTLQSHKS